MSRAEVWHELRDAWPIVTSGLVLLLLAGFVSARAAISLLKVAPGH